MRISDWSSDVCSSDLSARSRLPDNQRKLIVQFARSDRDGRVLYGVGDLLIQIMPGIYLSGCLLDDRQRMDEADGHSFRGAEGKILNAALRLRSPIGGFGDFDGDRKRVVKGKGVSVRVDMGGIRCI